MKRNLSAIRTNVGLIDRLIRLVLAPVLFYRGLVVYSGSAAGIGLMVVSVVLAVTAAVGFCGFYSLLGIRTCPSNE